MKKLYLVVMLLAAVAGCVQNPPRQSQGTKSTTKNFDACGLSVKFSGQPEEMPGSMYTSFSKEFDAKPEGHTWLYLSDIQGIRKLEFALCMCPSETMITEVRKSMIVNQQYVNDLGFISESPTTEIENGARMRLQTTISAVSKCVMLQGFAIKGSPDGLGVASSPFFSSLALIVKEQQPLPASSSPTASDRLRQLDQLLNEKLITREEFDRRRAAIVDAL